VDVNSQKKEKMKANKVSIAALSVLVIVLLGIISTRNSTGSIPPGEIDGRIEYSPDHYFSLQQLHQELAKEEPEVMFIDLRHPDRYEINHIPGAVNMYVEKILCPKCIKHIRKADKPIVLVAETEREGVQGWVILRNAGFNDLMVLAGGYNMARENVIKNYRPKFNRYFEEKAKYDYSKYFSNSGAPAPPPKPVMKQATQAAGGC